SLKASNLRGGVGVLCIPIMSTQHLHLLGDDLGCKPLLTVLACPFTGAQTSFYVNGAAFAQVFARNFSQTVVEHYTHPLGFLLAFACSFVPPRFSARDGDIAYRHSLG